MLIYHRSEFVICCVANNANYLAPVVLVEIDDHGKGDWRTFSLRISLSAVINITIELFRSIKCSEKKILFAQSSNANELLIQRLIYRAIIAIALSLCHVFAFAHHRQLAS